MNVDTMRFGELQLKACKCGSMLFTGPYIGKRFEPRRLVAWPADRCRCCSARISSGRTARSGARGLRRLYVR
jgi:hypothetical protein